MHVVVWIYTKNYINTKWGLGGICCLITGNNSTIPTITGAIEPILYPTLFVWKNIPIFRQAINHKGANIVTRATNGNLYKGVLKWAN